MVSGRSSARPSACGPSEHPLGQLGLGDGKVENRGEGVSISGQHGLEGPGLGEGPREAVEDEPPAGVGLGQALPDHGHDQVVGDELPPLHDGLRLLAESGLLADGLPQDLARGDGRNAQPLRQLARLGSLAAARRPEEDHDPHQPRRPRIRLFFRKPV